MSATQHVFPLSKVLTPGADESWLEGQGLARPAGWERSRYPTARELRAALTSLDGHYMAEFIEGDELRFWFHVDSAPESTEIYLEGYAPRSGRRRAGGDALRQGFRRVAAPGGDRGAPDALLRAIADRRARVHRRGAGDRTGRAVAPLAGGVLTGRSGPGWWRQGQGRGVLRSNMALQPTSTAPSSCAP